ncbi:MAG: glycosyltransferase family 4 protein [Planctomycetes bacterium]|nr:glycosyltransferase family 4 protein [Planctomycetota bacterium]
MKVALVLYRFAGAPGGVERYAQDLSAALVERGHEVHCFSHERPADGPPGVLFHPVPAIDFYGPLRILSFARNSERALRRIADTFDVVHGFGRTYLQDIYRVGSGCHREYMQQTYASMRSPVLRPFKLADPRHRAILHVEGKIFRERRYSRVTCISKRVREELGRYHGIPEAEAEVIYNGFDPTRFHPGNRERYREEARREWGVPAGAFCALFVGSGFARKGLGSAIQGMAGLGRDADWRLVVVGRGPLGRYRRLSERCGASDRVLWLGPRSDMPRHYAAADVLLFPTLYEPFGTVVLEAMATGVPVVTSRIAGASEVIEDGVDSCVVPDPRVPADLTARLRELLDTARRERMGEAAARTSLGYVMEANVEATLRVYREVAARKGKGQGREESG